MLNSVYKSVFVALTLGLNMQFAMGQNIEKAQEIITKLCSDDFAGRGYIDNGERKAADYIARQFKEVGLLELEADYFQFFKLDVNTFPKADVSLDGKQLQDGIDFVVNPNSSSGKLNKDVFYISPKLLHSKKIGKKVKKAVGEGLLPVVTSIDSKDSIGQAGLSKIYKCKGNSPIVLLKDNLTWSVGRTQSSTLEIWVRESEFDPFAKTFTIDVSAEVKKNYRTQNVMGFVEGTEYPDSFIIFCGHYDHLGKMDEAIYAGANDNASGIAMLIDMADYFVANPSKYSVAFVAFGAEEAGLVGSRYYVENPPIKAPLRKTKFVFNMDLMGSGESGATIVNATIFPSYFELLESINKEKEYLPVLKKRGKAANSDHYFFSEAGIPSFFIYLMGDYKHYHIPQDNADNLTIGPFYNQSFLLIRDFIIEISN